MANRTTRLAFSDTLAYTEAMYKGQVHRTVCLFTPQLSPELAGHAKLTWLVG